MKEITDKFTTHLKNVLTRALCVVVEQNGTDITPLHLLWAVGTETGAVGAELMEKAGVTAEALAELHARATVTSLTAENRPTPLLNDDAKLAIEKAVLAASVREHRYVGTEHLLAGLLRSEHADVLVFLRTHDVKPEALERSLSLIFQATNEFPEAHERAVQHAPQAQPETEEHTHSADEHTHDETCPRCGREGKTPALDACAIELTSRAVAVKIDPLIGREREVHRLAQILLRRTKNNPLLIGEPGVGKTAVVEGLAKAIVAGKVPNALLKKRIFRVDLSALVAGTMYRGDFEARLEELLDEAYEHPEFILFFDEIHTIVGAGAASGSLDAANILKPALARGEIRVIGATTPAEYKREIAPDGALDRRFQTIIVREPSLEETRAILEGLRPHYERFHNVRYSPAAMTAALTLADRYLHGKQFPDKAVDVLDETGAHAMLSNNDAAEHEHIRELESAREEARLQKMSAVMEERFGDALVCKTREENLRGELAELQHERRGTPRQITAEDIARTVARMSGVAMETIAAAERGALRTLGQRLARRVVGQTPAVERAAKAVRRARLGLARADRPLASFLFVGPSGVGKTSLARALAEEVFGEKTALLRFDMSEFAEGFTVSKLIGAPAGYVGYRDRAKLTDAILERPHAVVLFDEIEKAHPDVHHILLQLLDDGVLTDATGRTVSFRNAIVILTTNAGRDAFTQSDLGFGESSVGLSGLEERLRKQLEDNFRPEFLNRIDHFCIFRALERDDLAAIVRLALIDLEQRLKTSGATLRYAPTIINHLVAKIDPKLGARDVTRVVTEMIEHPLADLMLEKDLGSITIDLNKDGELNIGEEKKVRPAATGDAERGPRRRAGHSPSTDGVRSGRTRR